MNTPRPASQNDLVARAVFAFLARLAPDDAREELVGDLHEEWSTIVLPERGPRAARAWLVRQAALSAAPLIALRVRRTDAGLRASAAITGFAIFGAVYAASEIAWRSVLYQVPLRASHAPSAVWSAVVLVLALVLASVGAALAAMFLGLGRRRPS